MPWVTSGVRASQVGGEVSSWVGYGVAGTRLTRAMFEMLTLEGSGVPCLTGIENVGWVFLRLSILTLAEPDLFLYAGLSVGRGGSNFRDLMFLLPYYLLNLIKYFLEKNKLSTWYDCQLYL